MNNPGVKRRMNTKGPSETFRILYHDIIEELLYQAYKSVSGYCVKDKVDNNSINIAIWKKYEEYRKLASNNVLSRRLDRHKLAACVCATIVQIQPLTGVNGQKIKKTANEIVAMLAAFTVLKYYMITDYLQDKKNTLSAQEKENMKVYIKENFQIECPTLDENIGDRQEYEKNLLNALRWTRTLCRYSNKKCCSFDIWAYATIFYHLETYNRKRFNEVCKNYIDSL